MELGQDTVAGVVDCVSGGAVAEGGKQGHVGPDGSVHPQELGG